MDDNQAKICKKLPMPGFEPGVLWVKTTYPNQLDYTGWVLILKWQRMREAQGSIPCSSTLLSQKNTLCRVAVIAQLGERFYWIHGYGTIFESSINSVGRVLVL